MAEARRVVHIDMDAFYAAVSSAIIQHIAGVRSLLAPIPRGAEGGVWYRPRPTRHAHFGVHSAMPISQAYRLCPQAIFLPVRMRRYHEVSERIFAIFQRYTDVVEPLSIDEAFIDAPAALGSWCGRGHCSAHQARHCARGAPGSLSGSGSQ